MGKAQYKKRIRTARHQANGISKASTDTSLDGTPTVPSKSKNKRSQNQQREREATVAVLDKITSPASHDRIWSLAAISNLVLSSTPTRQLLLSKNLVRLLINRLVEDEDHDEILVEVTGVMRNLVIEGGRDICGEMANKGILQPLNGLTSKLVASISNFQDSVRIDTNVGNHAAPLLNWNRFILISENVIIILWSLAETSHKWLDSVCFLDDVIPLLSSILEFFTHRLHPDQAPKSMPSRYVVPSSCALAAGQCLYALTEDQPKLAKRLVKSNDNLIQALSALCSTCQLRTEKHSLEDNENVELLQVVSIGILRNLTLPTRKRQGTSLKSPFDKKMLKFLMSKLRVDLIQLAAMAAEANGIVPKTSMSDYDIAKASTREPSAAELQLESLERRLSIVQLSLELVSEWCATADGFDEDYSSNTASSTEEPIDPDELSDARSRSQLSEDDGAVSEPADIVMEEIPPITKLVSTKMTTDHSSDHDSDEENPHRMDIEEQESSALSPHTDLFLDLLAKLPMLAKPTAYLYQSQSSGTVSSSMIPTAADSDGAILTASAGTVPCLINELLSGIHLRATDALNNMVITVERLGGDSRLFASEMDSTNQEAVRLAWQSLFSTLNELVEHAHLYRKGKQKALNGSLPSLLSSREQLLTSVLTCIWSFSRVFLKPGVTSPLLDVSPHHVKFLTDMLRTSDNEIFKARALSILVCFGSRPSVSVEENALIGEIFMETISSATKPNSDVPKSLLIGALDGVFDLYADETRLYDQPVFQQRKFLETLLAVVPNFQTIVKKIDKRKDPNLRQQAEEVHSNLLAFIEYRKGLK